MGPCVSVIIPVHNSARFLRQAVLSVLADSLSETQIIVIDDGSTDDSMKTVSDLPVTRLELRTNSGPGAARNAALSFATGEYLAFLDSDDLLSAGGLSWRIRWLDEHPEERAVVGNPEATIDLDGNAIEYAPDIPTLYHRLPERITWAGMFTHGLFPSPLSATMFRASAFREIGHFDKALLRAEDRDFMYRLLKKYDLRHLNRPVFRYRIHDKNISVRAVNGSYLCSFRRSESYRILVDMEHGVPVVL